MQFVVAERQEFAMSMHVYRGFEIYPLIYPHVPAPNGCPHNYDAGFDAAVRGGLANSDRRVSGMPGA
ncbi:hypothetical protein C5615_34995 [Burkholderia cepacia]|uniref:Uncharacterized protein n=1 Tax=Burkholderia cepacia TaxID=292 RepID=A0A2S8I3C9_BURCE|nr:hypothetical protein C5615_34995 [Burkholderia cepacia]